MSDARRIEGETGEDDAKPGIIMQGTPQVGVEYRQEYYDGEAEDMAEVLSLDETVAIDFGTFGECLRIREWTPLEPGVESSKFYAPGIGLVFEQNSQGPAEHFEWVEIVAVP